MEGLQLVQSVLELLSHESVILADPDDVDFFKEELKEKTARKATENLTQIEKKPPILSNELQTIKPLTQPKKIEQKEPHKIEPTKWNSNISIPHTPLNFAQLKNLFQKLFPGVSSIDEIPSDLHAKRLAKRWKTKNQTAPISILHFNEPLKQKKFLSEVVKALDLIFGPAKLVDAETIEKNNEWEVFLSSPDLKFIITCDHTLWQLPNLLRYYKEDSENKTRTLKGIPLLLLPALSLYLKDPLLKRSLWKSLCQRLSS